MARGSKMRLNREALDKVVVAAADGMFAFAQVVVDGAQPPDSPPAGKGLTEGRGAAAWVDGKKVAGTTIGGRAVKKPRGLRTPKGQIVVIGGFGFPAHLVHNGSIHNRPNPFLARSLAEHIGEAESVISTAASAALRGAG